MIGGDVVALSGPSPRRPLVSVWTWRNANVYIEKMLAGLGVSALALVTYVAGKQAVADFLGVVAGYAHHCLAVASWGN